MRAMRAGRQVQGVVSFCVCAGGRVRGLLDRAGGGGEVAWGACGGGVCCVWWWG
ncbi:hypothetical protein TPADAL_0312a [Treponema pallidum subsp. pallidum DAL-1]|uniref:Uncharacterized protein n=2 Tax=Treponema pallidum TaxID=160 RepID=A0AAU8RVD5_TREPL|nr:hypothetical protein TPESAMD_0312a [Treponema pallidum subsp. pertenue str. SamoaD]AEZ58499.1 hypothetical protein TPECDC2_0312a [Treponema pallidum subsp. pertenue str. CDC2]AEZ59567.1 hypothetical protein TPEGAU_0312a [Treponema pallidum subsp. pertenue str. Gauthier]AEZ60631.1 hypothetical protein TPADAL_0312a [Treponema pallidum subsp. pallidum DAL-1]AGK83954.1 hypothetical protein TPFB_0312a [Treponema pallidum str. Fribourg-Blanc]AJB40330.1 hypothetical protein TENDBA_0312a [Treponema